MIPSLSDIFRDSALTKFNKTKSYTDKDGTAHLCLVEVVICQSTLRARTSSSRHLPRTMIMCSVTSDVAKVAQQCCCFILRQLFSYQLFSLTKYTWTCLGIHSSLVYLLSLPPHLTTTVIQFQTFLNTGSRVVLPRAAMHCKINVKFTIHIMISLFWWLNMMVIRLNTLAATYEVSRNSSVLFSRDVRVNSYLTLLWTTVAQQPHKL